ncbi:hypothetical protein RND81_09G030900 [Saponaria officinalis]|uniref:Uncharacterized protein n=1 Tax=Saponaria officinalis TaxID=3572 RepID=A0AAW1IHU2_SAPOF
MDLLSKAYSDDGDDDDDEQPSNHRPQNPINLSQPPPPKRLKLPNYPPTPYPKPDPTPQLRIPQTGAPIPGRYISKREKLLMASASGISDPNPPPSIPPPPSVGSISKENLRHDIQLYLRKQANVVGDKKKFPSRVSIDLHGHLKPVNAVQWSTNHAHLLASAGMDKTVYIWNVWSERQKKVREFTYHNGAVKDVRWSPHRNSILSCGYDCSSRLVDIEKGTESQVFSENQAVTAIKFHPRNPNLFLSGGSKGFLKLWDIRTGKTVHEYVRQLGPILDVEFMVDGKQFISSSDVSKTNLSENSLIVWDVSREVPLSNQLYVEAYTCPVVRCHPFEPSFVAQSNGNYIAIFSTKHPFKLDKYKRYESHDVSGFPIKCDFSANGEVLASGSSDGCIYFYNVKSANLIKKIIVYDQPCIDVVFHPLMPNVVACGSWSGNVSVIE